MLPGEAERRGGRGREGKGWRSGPTHISILDDEVSGLAVPQHRQHVLLLALALPDHEVPRVCQQLSHLCPRDGSVVPQLLMQGLLHLWNELQRWGELDRDRGGARRGHSASPSAEATRPASWGVSGSLSYTPRPHKARECHKEPSATLGASNKLTQAG